MFKFSSFLKKILFKYPTKEVIYKDYSVESTADRIAKFTPKGMAIVSLLDWKNVSDQTA